jgi:16S rRNA (guanine1207-N2)-methyltransferase
VPARPPEPGHYFAAQPAVASRPGTVPLVLPDLTADLAVDRGVFSTEHVDPGTRHLLLDAPAPAPGIGTALDLGCGYGPIAVTLATRAPGATVWAVDVNERAVALCRANAEALGLANVRATVVSDDRPRGDVPDDVRFDLIWSNPPVRIGKPALHALLDRWLDRLAPGGEAWLVVHKHLGSDSLQRWLTDGGRPTRRHSSRAGYRILVVGGRTA